MTVPFVRRSGGINYIRINNGIPCVYTGASGNAPIYQYTVCQTGAITSDFAITFIDEAHPLYVIGSGEIGGMWGPDLYYYNENIDPNFPSCAHILFDVDTPYVARGSYQGQSITEDPFYVVPTGVTTTTPEGCELPMPELNIVQIPRPSGGIESDGVSTAIGTISQLEFKNAIISGIQTVWGTDFWTRMSESSNKLWIIRESGLSLGSGVIQSGIDLFKDYLASSGIDYTEHFPTCGDTDRYLGWLTDCITYNGDNVSCTGIFQPLNIMGDIQGSGTHDPTNKLVTINIEGYTSSSGSFCEPTSSTSSATIHPVIDDTATFTSWYTTNGYLGSYYTYDCDALAMTSEAHLNLRYINNIHILEVSVQCYEAPTWGSAYNWTVFKCIVPVDKYGVPNGTVEADSIEFESIQVSGGCTPRLPNITFFSHVPTSFATASGIDCTQFNP